MISDWTDIFYISWAFSLYSDAWATSNPRGNQNGVKLSLESSFELKYFLNIFVYIFWPHNNTNDKLHTRTCNNMREDVLRPNRFSLRTFSRVIYVCCWTIRGWMFWTHKSTKKVTSSQFTFHSRARVETVTAISAWACWAHCTQV